MRYPTRWGLSKGRIAPRTGVEGGSWNPQRRGEKLALPNNPEITTLGVSPDLSLGVVCV